MYLRTDRKVLSTMNVTFSETGGQKRNYSYKVNYPLPTGEWDARNIPKELINELEAIAQSDSCPSFLHEPEGNVLVSVS